MRHTRECLVYVYQTERDYIYKNSCNVTVAGCELQNRPSDKMKPYSLTRIEMKII
jgi:hypothetical protein